MTDPNKPAFPCNSHIHGKPHEGLSLREYLIGQALAGLSGSAHNRTESAGSVAHRAIALADAVIQQLRSLDPK